MKNKICFIPARDSSTRLKNKNVSAFRNGNLITNTIEQAIESNFFDQIILSSNSDKILDIGKKYNIKLHKRLDIVDTLIEVIQSAIVDIDLNYESTFGLLLVTCPLREVSDITNAYNIFEKYNKKNTVVSVKKNENPIQMAWKNVEGYLKPIMPDEYKKSTRKQDHYDTFFYNDAIIFDTVKNFMNKDRNLYGLNPVPYFMPWERSLVIDYEFQLKIAQCLGEEDG